MPNLKPLTDKMTQQRYFKHAKTGMTFRRTAGGIAWPEEGRPGAVCVLGESRDKQCFYGNRHYDVHVLEEIRTESTATLLDEAARMTADWYIGKWSIALHDKRSYLLDDFNDELRRLRLPVIKFCEPMGLIGKGQGQLPYYHSLVELRTRDEKTLFLHGASAADELRQLNNQRTDYGRCDLDRSPTDFPGMAALCFALADIDINRTRNDEHRRYDFGVADLEGGY